MWFIQLVHIKQRDMLSFVLCPRNDNDLTSKDVSDHLANYYPGFEIEQLIRIANWEGVEYAW